MKKKDYSFITRWQIEAPIEDVWNSIYESAIGRSGGKELNR